MRCNLSLSIKCSSIITDTQVGLLFDKQMRQIFICAKDEVLTYFSIYMLRDATCLQ